jgi:SNF2 family DNA or RNA helicase
MKRTYGKLYFRDGNGDRSYWFLEAEPHVMLRAKRMFERIRKDAGKEAMLSDSPENARDLLWFLDRYPLKITPRDRCRLVLGAQQFDERILTLEKILGGKQPPREFKLALPPREYQRQAAEVYLKNGSLLLGDDVGLGKTVTAIASLTEPRTLPAAIVTLGGAMPRQWAKEIERFAPDLFAHVLKKGRPYELPTRNGRKPDVFVLNYHKLSGWADVLAGHCKSVIFDEVQELRHSGSSKYSAARAVRKAAQFGLGMSATPIYNYGGELFNVMQCVAPGALGTADEFHREWCTYTGRDHWKIAQPKAFGTYLRETFLMLRRTRADVGRELPALSKIPYTIDSDRAALDLIEGSARELAKIVLRGAESFRGQKMQAAEELSNVVRQATGIAKAAYVAEFVRLLLESGEKVVLFGWHRAVYEIWRAKLAEFQPAFYTGSESTAQKTREFERFVGGETPLAIVSLRAGAGLDGLQKVCSTVAIGELDWSPGVHEQCIGRVHRDGQERPVMAYYLISDDGSDPVIASVLGLKSEQVEGIRNPTADGLERLEKSGDHIKALAERYLSRAS